SFECLAVQAQQELIQFADGFQGLFANAITFQRLPNLRNLLGPQAHLAGFSARIAYVKNPKRMALATSAFLTTGGGTNGALKQRATEDTNRREKLGWQFFSFADGLLACHQK